MNRGHDLATITADVDVHTAEVDLTYGRDALTRHVLEALVLGEEGASLDLDDLRLRWEANHEDIERAAACLIAEGRGNTGGLAWVGTIGADDFAYCTSWWVDGTVLVHELGHIWGDLHSDNWMVGHAMWGNWTPRWLGPSLHDDVFNRRDAVGSPATGPWPDPVEPFAMADVVDGAYGQVITIDVLANDHDANDEIPNLAAFDAASQWGGSVTRSVGTGPAGRDELTYTPSPLLPTNRNDSFWYRAGDKGEHGVGGLISHETRVKIVPAPGPTRVHWPLEGNGEDCTGFADAAIAGSSTWTASPNGQALVFDEENDLVSAAPLDLETDRLTIVTWLKRSGTQPGYAAIFSARGESGTLAFNFNPSSGTLGYHWGETDAWTWNSGLSLPDETWALAALVVEPQQATIYLHDGTLESAVRSATHTPFRLSYRLPQGSWIGSYLGWTSRVISGAIDGVRVYTSALNAAQIDQLYQQRYLVDLAECPTPRDGGRQPFFRPASLTWKGAAPEYDLYLGRDWSAVRDATLASPEYVGRQAGASYALPDLEPETLYWRVDPVNGAPLAVGDVWRLTGENGLAGHWKLDEGIGVEAVDSSGKDAHGVIDGAEWTAGIDGSALLFSGADAVTFGTKPALDGLVDFSLSAWVRTTTTSRGVLVQQRNGGFNGEYMFQIQPNGVARFFVFGGSQTQFDFNGTTPIHDGEWHHVVAVREGGFGRIYVDGALDAEFDGGQARPLDATIGVALGADIRDNTAYFQGELDDVRIFDLALNDQEVENIYYTTVPIFTDGFESGDLTAWSSLSF